MEEALRRSEERLRLATTDARVAVWEFDFLAGSMTRTDNHDALYGLPRQEIWTYDIFVHATHPADRELADRTVQASCAPGGDDDYAFDFRVIWPDRSVRWLAVTGHVVARDEKGAATLVRGALIDVTRLKDAVRARDEFVQLASHELNTPLTSLSLHIEGALRDLSRPDRHERLEQRLDAARKQVERLAGLVDRLLDAGRLDRDTIDLALADVDLAEVTRDLVEQFSANAQRVSSSIDVSLEPSMVRADRRRLEQAISNVLSNALKYGAGRPVHVSVARGVMTVRDQGIGIEPDALDRIFEKFERAVPTKHFGGLGLGLFVARQVVEAHGGTIAVESAPGRGSTFRIALPERATE